jgi:REP element-mobilizing transposase RayT
MACALKFVALKFLKFTQTDLMKYNPNCHDRRSIRLQGYDYSGSGVYFVTICTHQRQCLFGDIDNGSIYLNCIGKIVAQEWLSSSKIRQEIELDEWIIMPNHLHGLVVIDRGDRVDIEDEDLCHEGACHAPLWGVVGRRKARSLSSFIGGFKSSVTKRIKPICEQPNPVIWQRNYYETIVRDDRQLYSIRKYIINNPKKWDEDPEKSSDPFSELSIDFIF